MTPLDIFCIRDGATIEQAIEIIEKNNSRCVIVLGSGEKVIGVFSEGDVLRSILGGIGIHTPLRSLIKPSFRYLRSRDLNAARKLLLCGITLIPVLDGEFRLQDVITLRDVFKDEF